MSEIAKNVGIKVPSIYNHFSGKDELVWAALELEISEFFKFMDNELMQIEESPSLEKLRQLFYSIIQYFAYQDRIRFWRNMSLISNQELRIKTNELICKMENEMYEKSQVVFSQCLFGQEIKDQEIENMVLFYFLMIKGLLDVMITHQDVQFELEHYIEKIWTTYFSMIRYQ